MLPQSTMLQPGMVLNVYEYIYVYGKCTIWNRICLNIKVFKLYMCVLFLVRASLSSLINEICQSTNKNEMFYKSFEIVVTWYDDILNYDKNQCKNPVLLSYHF